MSWEDVMRRVLPPIGGVPPHITGAAGRYGAGLKEGRHPPSKIPHPGVDFDYVGGQTKLNLIHPALHSPVDGIVTNAGQGTMGRIAIKDKDGFVHEILHTERRHVAVGDRVVAGQLIGTMGNTGTRDQHAHYQLKDPAGKVIDPSMFWDGKDSAPIPSPNILPADDANPMSGGRTSAPASNIDGTSITPRQPRRAPSQGLSRARFNGRFYQVPLNSSDVDYLLATVEGGSEGDKTKPSIEPSEAISDRFGDWNTIGGASEPAGIDRGVPDQSSDNDGLGPRASQFVTPAGRFGDTRSPVLRALEKYRRSAIPDGSGSTSAPAHGASWGMPSSPPDIVGSGGVLGNDMDPSLSAPAQGISPMGPASSAPIAPDLPVDETRSTDSKPVRYLGRRVAGQPQASIPDMGAPAQPAPPQSGGPLIGIFSGQPMLPFPLPPSIWSGRNDARAPDDDEEERFSRWLRLLNSQ